MNNQTLLILAIGGAVAFYVYRQSNRVTPQNPNGRNPELPMRTDRDMTVPEIVNSGVEVLERLRTAYGDF